MFRRAAPLASAVLVAPVASALVAGVPAPVAVAPAATAPAASGAPVAAAPVAAASAEDTGGLAMYTVFSILFFTAIIAAVIVLVIKWYMNKQVATRLSDIAKDVNNVAAVAKGVRTSSRKSLSKSGVRSSHLKSQHTSQDTSQDTGTESDGTHLQAGQERGRGGAARAGTESGSDGEKASAQTTKGIPGDQRAKDIGTKSSPLLSRGK